MILRHLLFGRKHTLLWILLIAMPILLILLALPFLRTPIQAQEGGTITVCRSGCVFSDLQKALDAAVAGNRIVLTAGETFVGNFRLPPKAEGGDPIIIESSRMDQLPPSGVRVQAAHAEFMPKLIPQDTNAPVIRTSETEQYVERVDPATDTFHYGGPHGYVEDDRVAFWAYESVPQGLQLNQVYFVRFVSRTAIQIALTKGGPAVDIQSAPQPRYFRSNSTKTGSGYKMRGIEFSASPAGTQQFGLVEIGGITAMAREGITSNIELDHVYIHGLPESNGPRVCLTVNARHFTLTNSRLEHCNKEAEEAKGILMVISPGPALIQNNYIEGGSINMLIGGDFVRITDLVSGDEGGIEIFGNHFYKPMSVKYTAGTGGSVDPQGACSGGRYLNTETGKWFVCGSDSQWTSGPACARGEYFRRTDVAQSCGAGACWACSAEARFVPSTQYRGSGYAVKNLFEVKSGKNLYIHGNVFENNWVNSDQSGVAIWVISQVPSENATPWVRGESILFTNNIVRNSSQGIRVASQGNATFGKPNRDVRVINNLLYDIGATETPSIASRDARPISFAGECVDCQFSHNTVISGVTGGTGVYFDTKPMTNFRFTNNIGHHNAYGFLGDGGLPISLYAPNSTIQNNILIADQSGSRFSPGSNRIIGASTPLFADGKASLFRLHPESPFSAGCTANCEYAADDDTDLGANIDQVEQETSGAVTGTPNWNDTIGLTVSAVGSDKATLSYYVRDETVCSLRVSTNASLSTSIADTNADSADGRHLDNRDGNSVDGSLRRFVIGTREPLRPRTKYFFRLTCGAGIQSGSFQTEAGQ